MGIDKTENNLENILLTLASGLDYQISTRLAFTPTENYHEAGLLIYQDDDNYVLLSRAYVDGGIVRIKSEIGGVTSNLEYISNYYANNGVSDIRCDVFLARDVEFGDNHPEAAELIEIKVFPKNEVFRMAYAGEITDGMSALSLFLCKKYL